MTIQTVATKKFKTRVVNQSTYGTNQDFGEATNTMKLKKEGKDIWIEWGVTTPPLFFSIPLYIEKNQIVDYDNVFSLPREAIQLLKKAGYNTSAVED